MMYVWQKRGRAEGTCIWAVDELLSSIIEYIEWDTMQSEK